MCKLAAMASQGQRGELPLFDRWDRHGEKHGPFDKPETTIYLNVEDDPGVDTKKRLRLCGADMSKIHYVNAADLSLNFYSPAIEAWLQIAQPSAIIFDPVQQFFNGFSPDGTALDMNSSASVRPALTHLNALAKKYNTAVILICHPNKNSFNSALYSTMGSNDFTAAPRSALYIGRDPDNRERRVIAIAKANSVPDRDQSSLCFDIDFADGVIKWGGTTELQADDIRDSKRQSRKTVEGQATPKEKRTQGEIWLESLLEEAGGYMLFKDIQAAFTRDKIDRGAVYRAKEKMKFIKSTPKGNGKMVFWYFDGYEPPEQTSLADQKK
jgi:hypothetical protein